MTSKLWQGKAEIIKPQYKRCPAALWFLLAVLLVILPLIVTAQDKSPGSPLALKESQALVQEPENVAVTLPTSLQMARYLATPGSRYKALINITAAASVLSGAADDMEMDHVALAKQFEEDRAWLQMLIDRYGWVKPRSSVLDPAAWLVLGELQQHDLDDHELVFPGRTPEMVLMYQVFQRSQPRLAAANLPELLLRLEAAAIPIWDGFLQLTISEGSHDVAWKSVELGGLSNNARAAEQDELSPEYEVVDDISLAMSKLVLSTVDARPPDTRELIQLRYSLLLKLASFNGLDNSAARQYARQSLFIVNLLDGLHDGEYFEFIRGLVSVTSNLLEMQSVKDEFIFPAGWLVAELPIVSSNYAEKFANVDPRLNRVMAAVFDVLKNIVKASVDDQVPVDAPDETTVVIASHIKESRKILADSVAQMTLMIPDMSYYFDLPVRAKIVEEINICISIAASRDDAGQTIMTRSQFDACIEALLQLADKEARLAELSGDVNGPFTTVTLQRELNVPSWQRINYGIGYLHRRQPSTCQLPATALPNPLEWAVLATTITWFAETSPEYFYTPENEARLTQIRSIGEQLILELAEQAACLASGGAGPNDLLSRSLTDYELALRELGSGIKKAELDFRTQRLRPDADVSLARDGQQGTSYRPGDLVIEPCDKRFTCDMTGQLSTTRALIGLFPDEYLIAEQTGMGRIEICYQNMEWVQRRSELVRADDENVANYFGHMGFDLMGRYIEDDQVSDIFGFRFTSPEEYHYLFAQASEEVLKDSCPVEWVGTRVVTPLRQSRGGIVPDRLTYLAASRKLPSRLLQNNWDQGAEWRDWFVTGIGVAQMDIPPAPDIMTRLNQHLQTTYQEEQAEVYRRVLIPNSRNAEGDSVSLFTEMSQVSINKALIRMQLMLFYPQVLLSSNSIREAVTGDTGLLDGRVLRRFREDNVALTAANSMAAERLKMLRTAWSRQPDTVRRQGSIAPSLMHALTRVNMVYRQVFTNRSDPLQEVEVTASQAE